MVSLLQQSDWISGRVPDEMQAQIRRLVEAVGFLHHGQPVGIVSADGVLLAADLPLRDLLGSSGDELLDTDWGDVMPSWNAQVRGSPGEADRGPRTCAFEEYALRADGEALWVHVVASPVWAEGREGEAGEAAGCPGPALAAWTVFLSDASPDEPDAEERRRRDILELLLESPSEFVVRFDGEGRVDFASPSLCHLLGCKAHDLLGRSLAGAHGASSVDFVADFDRLLKELHRPPFTAQLEMVLATPAGECIVQWTFEALIGDGGDVREVFGLGRDVSGRRLAERARERSELRLRTLVEATNQLVWVTGPGGSIDVPMADWMAFTGQSADDMLGDGWVDAVHPDDRERVAQRWAQVTEESGQYVCEYRLRRADGEYRWIASRAVPLPIAGGGVEYIGVGQDVTARKEAETGLSRRLAFETMLASISARLMNAGADSIDEAVDYALREVAIHTGVDSVSLHELGADHVTVTRARVWRLDGDRAGDDIAVDSLVGLEWLRERLATREIVSAVSVDELPLEAAAERLLWDRLGLRSIVAAPLIHDSTMIGFLILTTTTQERAWDAVDLRLLRVFADQVTGLLVWSTDADNLRRVSDCFLAFGADADENLGHICEALGAILGASFVLYNRRRGDELTAMASWEAPDDLPLAMMARGQPCADVIAAGDDSVHVIEDLQDTAYGHTSPIVKKYGLTTYAGFAVKAGGRPVACLCALFAGGADPRSSQLELFRVLGRAAAVEEERRLSLEDRLLGLAQLEQAMERTVATLSSAMGTRDPYTAGHERRVAQLAVEIATRLGYSNDEVRLLRLAATVHDIGKIAVPVEILSKPTRLSAAEFAIIKQHSQAGHDLLEPAGLPTEFTDAVLQHHERLDGSGYPQGLKNDEISAFARILAVADVVEAMAADRPYRPALGIEPALEEIRKGRGERYDPAVCDACLQLFGDAGFAFSD